MLVTKNADIYDYAKQVRWLGISKDTWSEILKSKRICIGITILII